MSEEKVFGNETVRISNPSNIIESIDSASNIFTIKFDALKSGNNILGLFDSSNILLIQSLIKSISIPELGFTDELYKRGGYSFHEAGEINIGDCIITTYNDLNSNIFSFWEKWYESIIKGKLSTSNRLSVSDNFNVFSSTLKDNYRLFPNEYKLNITIWKLFRTDNDKMYEIILNGCYPYNLNFSNLSWDNTDTVPEFSINLKVDKMYTNIFSTEIMHSNLSVYGRALQQTIKEKINLDNYKGNVKNFSEDNFSDEYKKYKQEINKKYKQFETTVKSRLRDTSDIIIANVKERLKAEIIKRLPADLRGLDFFNGTNLISQVLSKAEGWIRGQLLNGSDLINEALRTRGGNGIIKWNPTDYPDIDMNLIINKILEDWDSIINNSKNKETMIQNLISWDPLKNSTDETPDEIKFNPFSVSYEESIIKSENAITEILKGTNF